MLSRSLIRSPLRSCLIKSAYRPSIYRLYTAQGTAKHDNEGDKEDFQIYRSTPTHDQVRANLSVTTLGRPTEVLILRDAVDSIEDELEKDASLVSSAEQKVLGKIGKDVVQEEENGNSATLNSTEHAEILASLDNDSKQKNVPVDQEIVNQHLEKIRPKVQTGMLQPALHPTEANRLVQKIADMFTFVQLKAYYDQTSIADQVKWVPWQYNDGNHNKNDINALAQRIVHGLWEVALHSPQPLTGHSLYTLTHPQVVLLAGNAFQHPNRIARDWNVQFQTIIHKSADKSIPKLLVTGPQRNVKMALTGIEKLLSEAKTGRVSLTPYLTADMKANDLLGKISHHEFSHIVSQASIALHKTKSDSGSPRLVVSALDDNDIITTRLLLLDLLNRKLGSNKLIETESATSSFTRQAPLAFSTRQSSGLARLGNELHRFSRKDSYKAAEIFPKGKLKAMRQSIYDDALALTKEFPDAETDSFWRSQVLYDATVTLGQVLFKIPRNAQRSAATKLTDEIKETALFTPTVQNLMLVASRVSSVTHPIESKTTITLKLIPAPHQPSSSVAFSSKLPVMYWKFEAKKNESGVLEDLTLKNTTLAITQSQKNISIPFAAYDIRLDEGFRTAVKVSKQPKVEPSVSRLKEILSNPETRSQIHDLENVSVELPRSLIMDPEFQKASQKQKSKNVRINYMFLLPEVRHELRFWHEDQPIILSTVESCNFILERIELSTQTRTIMSSEIEKQEPLVYELAKRTTEVAQALLSLTRVSKDHQILLRPEQRNEADIASRKIAEKTKIERKHKLRKRIVFEKAAGEAADNKKASEASSMSKSDDKSTETPLEETPADSQLIEESAKPQKVRATKKTKKVYKKPKVKDFEEPAS
jgi:hypothetical protein